MLNLILLQAAGGAPQSGFGFSSLIMIVMIIAIFYFFMIAPQQKKQKKINAFRDSDDRWRHLRPHSRSQR